MYNNGYNSFWPPLPSNIYPIFKTKKKVKRLEQQLRPAIANPQPGQPPGSLLSQNRIIAKTVVHKRNMKSVIKILIIGILLGLVACESENEKYALELINKVEEFEKQNGRLPNNVAEMGLIELENSMAFYEKKNDSVYVIWFGLGLGESQTYNSKTGKWTKGG